MVCLPAFAGARVVVRHAGLLTAGGQFAGDLGMRFFHTVWYRVVITIRRVRDWRGEVLLG